MTMAPTRRLCKFRWAYDKVHQTNRKTMILPLLAEMTGSIHVGLAAMGVGIGVGLTGLGMATAVGAIRARLHKSLSMEFRPSRLPKPLCSTHCSFWLTEFRCDCFRV